MSAIQFLRRDIAKSRFITTQARNGRAGIMLSWYKHEYYLLQLIFTTYDIIQS
jgi:hypothetical protein